MPVPGDVRLGTHPAGHVRVVELEGRRSDPIQDNSVKLCRGAGQLVAHMRQEAHHRTGQPCPTGESPVSRTHRNLGLRDIGPSSADVWALLRSMPTRLMLTS
jgi:hypothetical protein